MSATKKSSPRIKVHKLNLKESKQNANNNFAYQHLSDEGGVSGLIADDPLLLSSSPMQSPGRMWSPYDQTVKVSEYLGSI
jgi:hypothetical protein